MNDNSKNALKDKMRKRKDVVMPNKGNPLDRYAEFKKEVADIVDSSSSNVEMIPICDIVELKIDGVEMHNRTSFSVFENEEVKSLAENIASIEEDDKTYDGLLNPIIVRLKDGKYERISGERRVRAFILNNKTHIAASIRNCSDLTARKIRNSENKQRRELNDYDELIGELEELKMVYELASTEAIVEELRKNKQILIQINKVRKKYEQIKPDETELNFIASSLSDLLTRKGIEDILQFELVVKQITGKTIGSLVNKLTLLNMNESVVAKMRENLLSYTEASILNSKLGKNKDLLEEIIEFVISKGENRLTKEELTVYVNHKLSKETTKEAFARKRNRITILKSNMRTISSDEINKLPSLAKAEAENIIKEIEEAVNRLKNLTEKK